MNAIKAALLTAMGTSFSSRTHVTVPLALILLGAFALRLHGIAFGLPALNDPDELMFQAGAVKMLSGPTLNPGWFGHPATTTMYLLAVIDAGVFAIGWLAGWFASVKDFADAIYADPSWVILPGRVAMSVFGVGCVYLTYRLARELFGKIAGLAAAAMLAVNPVHISWSQVIRSDIMASVFLLLCMLAAVRIARGGGLRAALMASLWLALAVTTKWPFALAALAVFGAVGLRMCTDPGGRTGELRRAAIFAAGTLVLILLISPFLLLDHETLLRNLRGEAQARHLGATGGGLLFNAWWYVSGPIFAGLGAAGTLLAIGGLALLSRRTAALVIVGPVIVAFFLLICAQHLIWERWALPLLPPLSVVAGAAFALVADFVRARLSAKAAATSLAIAGAALLIPPVVKVAENARERLHDTRQIAAAWAHLHIPPGRTVMVEHFGFDLLREPWRFLFPAGELGCVDPRALLQGKVQYTMVDGARGSRSNIDYGTLPVAQRQTCTADFAILTQYDRYRAERTAFPAEYAAYHKLLSTGRVVATISPVPGKIGGPMVTVVSFGRTWQPRKE